MDDELSMLHVISLKLAKFKKYIYWIPGNQLILYNFAHAQTLSRMSSLSGRMNIGRVNIELFPGWKKIKQRRISFVLGYLRVIL
jgi:hypothetical protein